MKILLINQTFYPDLLATSQQVTDLAEFLVSKGHKVTVFADRRGYEERKKVMPRKESWRGIQIERVFSTGFGKGSILRRVIDSLSFDIFLALKLLFCPRFDLVVSFTSPPMVGFLGVLVCSLKGGRAVQWLMDVNPDAAFEVGYINRSGFIGKALNAVFEWTLKNSQDIVVLDRWMQLRIEAHGVPSSRITVIPPWSVIDKRQNAPAVAPGIFRRANALGDKFIILYSGNHSVVHPLDTVLQAALKLRDEKDVLFVFAGSGLRTRDVERFRDEHRLENIKRLPWQTREALQDSFSSVDLHLVVMGANMSGLVHTSKIYSVLASGRPYVFVGPENSHVVDLLKTCPGGRHVSHGDVETFVQLIHWYKALPGSQLEAMGARNKEYLAANFRPENVKERFEAAIVLRNPQPCPPLLEKESSLSESP